MAGKRFTATGKWGDKWFRQLSPMAKMAWFYLCDNCDAAGVIELDREMADFQIGCSGDWNGLIEVAGDRLEELPSGRLWLTKFIDFQYGKLSADCAAHGPVFVSIEKNSLDGRVSEGIRMPYQRYMDKDKDKKRGCKGGFQRPTLAEVAEYCTSRGRGIDPDAFLAYYESNGWRVGKNPMKDWKAAVRTWERNYKKQSVGPRLPTAEEDANWSPV